MLVLYSLVRGSLLLKSRGARTDRSRRWQARGAYPKACKAVSLGCVSFPFLSLSLNDGGSFLEKSKVAWDSGASIMASVRSFFPA